jgi:MFS family permease
VRHRRVTPSAAFAQRVGPADEKDGECAVACAQDGPPAALKPDFADTVRFLRVFLLSRAFHTIFWASAAFSFYFFAMLYIVVPFGSKFGNPDTVSPYMHYAEITTGKAATLFTFFGVAKWISSFIGGALSNKTDVSLVFAIGGAINAMACFAWGLCISYWQLALVCIGHGVGVAFMFATLPAAAGRCFAGPFVGLAVGLAMCGFCIGGFTGATVVTSLNAAHHNNFLPSFILMGAMCLLSAAIFLIGLGRGGVKQQHFATKQVLLENRGLELPAAAAAASPIVGYAAIEA